MPLSSPRGNVPVLDYSSPNRSKQARRPWSFTTRMNVSVILGTAMCALWFLRIAGGPIILLGVAFWIGVLVADRRQRRRPAAAERDPLGWRVTIGICAVITLATAWAGFDHCRCFHATSWYLGPYGIAWSDSGGPCHNYSNAGGSHLFGKYYFARHSHL